MKKITLFFLFTLCVSCLKSTFYEDPQKDVSPLITKGGHTSTGLLIAKEDAEFILHLYFPDKDTLSCESVDTYAGTAMYIFNFINGGWAAIAGDKRMSPLLAYDKEGALDTSIQHDGLQTWIGLGIDEFIALQEHYPPSYSTSYSDYWNHFRDSIFIDCSYLKTPNTKSGDVMYYWVKEFWYSTTVSVTDYTIKDHLIPTKWGQGSPWNDSFPYMRDSLGVFRPCPAGCSAVAMAQILRYFNRFQCTPSWLYHNVSFSYNSDSTDVSITHSNLVNYSPAWDAMALNSSSSYPYSTKWYVRNLLLDVGGVLDMNYSPYGSGAFVYPSHFSVYDIACTKTDYITDTFWDIIYPELNNNHPVFIEAFGNEVASGKTVGHSWIIDGVVRRETIIKNYYRWMRYEYIPGQYTFLPIGDLILLPVTGPNPDNHEFDHEIGEIVVETVTPFNYFMLMNWGYDGDYDNGLYSIVSSDAWEANACSFYTNKKIIYGFNGI